MPTWHRSQCVSEFQSDKSEDIPGGRHVGAVCGPAEGGEPDEEGPAGQVRPLRRPQVRPSGGQDQHCQEHTGDTLSCCEFFFTVLLYTENTVF
jgi:hypothetical protein